MGGRNPWEAGWSSQGPAPHPLPDPSPPLSVHTDAGPPCGLQSHMTQLARAGPRQQTRVLLIDPVSPQVADLQQAPGAPRASVSHHMGQGSGKPGSREQLRPRGDRG